MPIASKKVASGLYPSQIQLGTNNGHALTTAGTTQTTGPVLVDEYNEFQTVPASGACTLPNENQVGLTAGDEVWVINEGANALAVFPPVGGYINNAAQNASVSVAVGAYAIFVRTLTALKWVQK